MDTDGKFCELTPADVAEIKAFIVANRSASGPFDIVVEGRARDFNFEEQAARMEAWEQAGATWWIEGMWGESREQAAQIIRRGPPQRGTGANGLGKLRPSPL